MKTMGKIAVVETIKTTCLALALAASVSTRGSDWPQYRGANHDGTSSDRIIDQWPTNGPPQLWKIKLTGYSTFVAGQEKVYTLTGSRMASDQVPFKFRHLCVALNANTGGVIWATSILELEKLGEPNSTPTLNGNCVYVLSNVLTLFCLDAATGAILWQRDLIKEFNGIPPHYGNASSPTVDGDCVFVNSGSQIEENILAFRKTDGALVWKRSSGALTYATPVPATILGIRQIVFRTGSELVSVVPETGAELWRFGLPASSAVQAGTPNVSDDIVFLGDSRPGFALRLSKSAEKFVAKQIWTTTSWAPLPTPVCHNGYAYGYAYGFGESRLTCMDLQKGTVKWSRRSTLDGSELYGIDGGLIGVDGRILILMNHGNLVLIEPSPESYKELACFKALNWGPCFNHPIVFNGRVYARSQFEGVCLDIANKTSRAIILGSPQRNADGSLEFPLNDEIGNCLPTGRIAKIDVVASTNLNQPLTDWQTISNSTLLTNGMLRWPNSNQGPQLFFRGRERP
jgi:outer membrane protein assembly factor BamB